MFESILNPKKKSKEHYQSFTMPLSFYDLNLNSIMDEIKILGKGYEILPYFYELPGQKEVITYRQGVCRDLENPVLYKGVLTFTEDMKKAREFMENSKKSTMKLQKECWTMNSAFYYAKSVRRLVEALMEGKPQGEGFQALLVWLQEFVKGEDFLAMEEETKRLMDIFSRIRYSITIEDDKIRLSREVNEELWEQGLSEMENPYGSILELSKLEEIALSMLEKSDKEGFVQFHDYYEKYHDFMNDTLIELEQEIFFYISYLKYIEKLIKEGFAFSYPDITEDIFEVHSCYDMALARKNSLEGKAVVTNEITYESGEKFFVITGPNQGGKTTFARAMGHVVYFSMLGLKAPGTDLKIPLFRDVITHFATEESVKTGSGKLKEELDRLAPLMKKSYGRNFVLINELFTTATTYDALIMGTRVMKHFMEKDCRGIYVTHIRELAGDMEGVTSLVASVDKKDSHLRTYKMKRQQPEGIGYASDIVEKYDLSLDSLRRRLQI